MCEESPVFWRDAECFFTALVNILIFGYEGWKKIKDGKEKRNDRLEKNKDD